MTPLRQRMLDALILRGMAQRTQDAYIDAVARLARYHHRSPDTLSAEEVQGFLLYLLRERNRSRSTVNQYACAYRFLYGTVLGLDGNSFQVPLARSPQRLPEILSREELRRLFAVACSLKSRTFLMLAYASGLRLSELCHLRVSDIDSAPDRICIRVEQGKGGRDRYVPMAPDTLHMLRAWWREGRPLLWLFPGATNIEQSMNIESAQRWYRSACAHAGITKRGGIHTLRHYPAFRNMPCHCDCYVLHRRVDAAYSSGFTAP